MRFRWTSIIALVVILVLFIFLMADLQRRLVQLQRMRKPAATSTH